MRNFILAIIVLLLAGCSTFKPTALQYEQLQTPTMQRAMDYGVYTPPGYQPGERLPLVLFLHGGGGSHHSFERYATNKYFDQKINSGDMSRMILVTPDGDNGFWENWHDGSRNYRDAVLQNVLPKVQRDYNTLSCPQNCYLAGISMGGFGALRFAHFARDTFSAVSVISAPFFTEGENEKQSTSWLVKLLFPLERIFGPEDESKYKNENPYNIWVTDAELRKMRLQIIWGDEDNQRIVESNQKFHQRLIDNNIAHDAYVYEGGHKWKYWVPNLDRVINFLIPIKTSDTEPITLIQ